MRFIFLTLLALVGNAAGQDEVTLEDTTDNAIWHNDLAKVCRPLDRSIDLLFVLDGSGSVAGDVFDTQMKMVNRVIDLIDIGPNATRMGIMQYSGWTRVEFPFDKYMNKDDLRKAVSEIGHFGGSTRTGKALEKADDLFSSSQGARTGRNDVAQVVVVVSDGRSIDDPKTPADNLRRQGVTVLTMGIGYNVFMPELERIAGGKDLAFRNETMDEFLSTFKRIAIGEVCDFAKGPHGAEIICQDEQIEINVKTKLSLHGHLYVAGFFNDQECSTGAKLSSQDADLRKSASLRIPLNRCGVQKQFLFAPRGLLFETTVILKYHPDYNSPVDQVFNVRCFYPDMHGSTAESNDALEGVVTPHLASFSAPEMLMPCVYKISRQVKDDCLIDMTRVGEPILHKWICDRSIFGDNYRILVHSCHMSNDKGRDLQVIDENGCSADEHLIATPIYSGDLEASIEGVAAKFAESPTVKFRCSISFCQKGTGECERLLPPRCGENRTLIDDLDNGVRQRTKRQIIRTELHNMPSSVMEKIFARRNFFFNAAKALSAEVQPDPIVNVDGLLELSSTTTDIPTKATTGAPPDATELQLESIAETSTSPPKQSIFDVPFENVLESIPSTEQAPVESGNETLGSTAEVSTGEDPSTEAIKQDKNMHLMGLSDKIVGQIDFNQVEIESQVLQVHDLRDTRDTGHKSLVNWCPRDIFSL